MFFDFDKLHEECGIAGVFNHSHASRTVARILLDLQHRGQEAVGIVSHDEGENFAGHRAHGLVSDNMTPEVLEGLPGYSAIGHVRYSTAGDTGGSQRAFKNIQPFFAKTRNDGIAIAHNGNLINADKIREDLIGKGQIFYSSSDTEVILHLVARSRGKDVIARIVNGLKKVRGSYALVILTEDMLIGVRDPFGIRPLVIGKMRGSFILASETCALQAIGATFVREVEPGEMVIISSGGLKSLKPFRKQPRHECKFEYIYFARPNSTINGKSVSRTRILFGEQLARESPAEADLVSAVPDSGIHAAIGFARASGIPYDTVLLRSHYAGGRTFIHPGDRAARVRLKLSVDKAVVKGKRIILVDDSLVRGTTTGVIVKMLFKAGAKEVHLRFSCPMIKYSCFFGIDTPDKRKLLAHSFPNIEDMRKHLGVQSIGFLSLEGLRSIIGKKDCGKNCGLCSGCFTGKYPVKV